MHKKNHKKVGTTEKRLVSACLLLAAAGGLTVGAGESPQMAAWYSAHIYPLIVTTVGRLSGMVPFSLSELILYGLVILTAGSFIHAMVKGAREKQGGAVFMQWASGFFLGAAVLVLLYVLNCGISYKRESFSAAAGIKTDEYTVEDLKQTCLWLTEEVNSRADKVKRNSDGVMELYGEEQETAVNAMEQLGRQYPVLSGYYPRPKGLLVSDILSYQGLTGVYSPFTVEANYNREMTPYNIPFTACHELSHLRGFMQEEEANYISFLACKNADSAEFQYSGYLMGWIYSTNALRSTDADAWAEVRQVLDVQVETDLNENTRFWNRYEGTVAEVSSKVNDTYLKVNGQTDGVKSYDRMVDLIVAYFLEEI
jgi:hypothetical protein